MPIDFLLEDVKKIDASEFGFTNLMRWRMPLITNGKDTLLRYDAFTTIEVLDDPTDSRKLSDFLKVGEVVGNRTSYNAIMLDSTLKLTPDFIFPKGKIVVANPDYGRVEFPIPHNMNMLRADVLEVQFHSKVDYGVSWEGFYLDLPDNKVEQADPVFNCRITEGAAISHIFNNLHLTYKILGTGSDFLKISHLSNTHKTEFLFLITDHAKLYNALGAFQSSDEIKTLDLQVQINFPHDIYPPIIINGRVRFKQ